ncbi:putative transposase [Theobroma cacao]|nr:putative transposase [Theobroma cacao]
MVKGKQSKPKPRSSYVTGNMAVLTSSQACNDIYIPQQVQQQNNDAPFETQSLYDAFAEQVENETSTHDITRSPSIDLSGNANEESSRSRGRGPSVGLQTLVDPSNRLRITPIGDNTFFERGVTSTITRIIKNHFHGPWSTWRKVPNDIKELMFSKFQEKCVWSANKDVVVRRIWEKICSHRLRDMLLEERHKAMIEAKTNNITECRGMSREWITNEIWDTLIDTAIELKRDVAFLEVFNRTHKRSGGRGDFIDNKSKSTSEMYNSVLSQKYGDESSSQLEFDPYAWTEAIGRKETTRTHVYGFGTRVPATALLTGTQSNIATSESACGTLNSNFNSPAKALEKKVKNLAQNLNKIHEEIRGEIREEMRNVMAEGMSEFMARMETMFMSNARSTLGDAGPSRLDK